MGNRGTEERWDGGTVERGDGGTGGRLGGGQRTEDRRRRTEDRERIAQWGSKQIKACETEQTTENYLSNAFFCPQGMTYIRLTGRQTYSLCPSVWVK